MNATEDVIRSSLQHDREQGMRALERIFAAADARAVFGEPVVAGNYTVITASEVTCGGGFGLGSGFGAGPEASAERQSNGDAALPQVDQATSGGGGMGAGGGAGGRPVAVIAIGPDGVNVKPVVDVTKLVLAGLTAWGAMLVAARRWHKAAKH